MTLFPENEETPVKLRGMTERDLETGLMRLCRSAGWNQRREDWELFLRLNPGGCFVAELDGAVVGTITTLNYADRIGWIAMLLVDPAMRRQGIGTRLLHRAMETLSNCATIGLDATPEGKKVYDGLGFVDEYEVSRMVAPTALKKTPGAEPRVRTAQKGDAELMTALDRPAFGAERRSVLETLLDTAPEYAAIAENESGKPIGFVLGRHGHRFEHVGPIHGSDVETAKTLARAAFARTAGKPLLVDTLLHTSAWPAWLRSLGFVEQRRFVRMYRGASCGHPQLGSYFAAGGPELG
jgi:ribosomal protein S18 acetylase RimI-like enzyme